MPTCRALGVGFVPYAPLGRGFLTGRFQEEGAFEEGDFRAMLPRFQKEALQLNKRLTDLVKGIAARKGCTPAQVSLAWLLAQGPDIVPIPGTKRLTHLADNIGALDVVLEAADLKEIDDGLSALSISGARYTEEGMKGVNA